MTQSEKKLNTLLYAYIKLLEKKYANESKNVPEVISVEIDKLLLYPFYLCTANGEESRKVMFESVFDSFIYGDCGFVEKDIKDYLDSTKTIPFLIKISDNELLIIDKAGLEIAITQDIIQYSFNGGKHSLKQLIDYCVNHISENAPNFLNYTLNDYSLISLANRSWEYVKRLNLIKENIKPMNSFLKDFFLKDKSPLFREYTS